MIIEFDSAQLWVKENRHLLRKYKGQWIAYNGKDGILSHHENMDILVENAEIIGKPFILKYVDPYFYAGLRRLLSIRV
jgi:hypothetical protein